MVKFAAMGVFAALCALLLKKTHPEMAAAVALGAGVLLLTGALTPLTQIVSALKTLGQSAQMADDTLALALKLSGVGLVAQLGAQTCKDAGQEALAVKVELFAKSMMLALTVPVLLQLLSLVARCIP